MNRSVDHYAMLGVKRDAPADAIRAAYIAQVKTWHPDFATTSDAHERFQAVRLAYDCLREPDRRARYDIEIADRTDLQLRRIGGAHRRLRKLDRRMPVVIAAQPVPHWRAAAVVAATGSLVLSVCYIFLR